MATRKVKQLEVKEVMDKGIDIIGKIYASGGMSVARSKDVFILEFFDTPFYNHERPQGVRIILPIDTVNSLLKRLDSSLKEHEKEYGKLKPIKKKK